MKDKKLAKKFYKSLSNSERYCLADELTMKEFNWQDWRLNKEPSSSFIQELQRLNKVSGD